MKFPLLLSLFLFFIISIPSAILVKADLPEFTGQFVISNTEPTIDRSVTITVYVNIYRHDGTQIPFITLDVYLMWSRDKTSWYSVTMETTNFNVFVGDIPAQDGSDNKMYNYGEGRCYWYALMRNEANEETTLFTSLNPNQEIFFDDPYVDLPTTTIEPETPEDEGGLLQPLEDIVGAFIDPTTNPFVRIILVAIVGLIVFLLASRGRGLGFIKRALSGLFR